MSCSPGSRLRRYVCGLLVLALVGFGLPLAVAPAAFADTAPTPPTPATVSADSLPTVQINGVVYDQTIVGNKVYAVGDFSSARPAGSPAGTNETPRSNILAYNLSTGALDTTFLASLNGRGYSVDPSADGTKIYVSGDFTMVNGTSHPYVVALDATTGVPIATWAGSTNARTGALDVSGNVVYVGGIFTIAGGQARSRIAAFDATTGALLPFAPTADAEVMTILSPDGSGKVVAGGHFQFANGQETDGLAAFNASDASLIPWTTKRPDGTTTSTYGVFPNYGPNSAFYSFATDGTRLIATAYNYHGPGTLENSIAITLASGQVEWANGCRGDTYSSAVMSGVVYVTGHAHDCSMIGGNPQTNPVTAQRALAETVTAAADGRVNTSGVLANWKAPELLHWLPTFDPGTYTGQSQAAWSIAADSSSGYVVVGGEFPNVNGVAQQGLSRFKTNSLNKEGPQSVTDSKPVLTALSSNAVRVSWTSSWDRDNRNLKYEVLRGGTLSTATVVGTLNFDSAWWTRPTRSFVDQTAPPGTNQTYRIRVTDPFNNMAVSPVTVVTIPAGAASSTYASAVTADAPAEYWRLGEPSGTTAFDWSNTPNDLTLDASNTRNAAGALPEADTATTFPGTAAVPGTTTGSTISAPTALTVEAWIKTTSTLGGKIVGFGNSATATSTTTDRHLYMDTAGKLYFGVTSASTARTLVSPTAYNDGQWHHVVGTVGAGGEALFVDAKQVGYRSDTTSAQGANGYWRVGGDNLSGWAGTHQNAFVGTIDEVAVYPTALAPARVAAHYTASGRTPTTQPRPSDTYGGAVYDSGPSSYWRLNETSGTGAADASYNGTAPATYRNGVVQGRPGIAATAAQFDGVDDVVSSNTAITNPTVYSEELWFTTTTTKGGKLIGFSNTQSGTSANYDRHVIMLDTGQVMFGANNGTRNIVTSAKSYNDGKWHHVVATQGADGMKLYLDAQLVGSNAVTGAQNFTGYWRVGGDTTWGGATSKYIAATIDEVAVYPLVLPAAQVTDHFTKGGGGAANQAPTAAFTFTTNNLAASFDASTSADPDGSISAYAWNFGDGTPAGSGVTTTHTYAAAGTYTVTLTVTDNRGATTSTSQAVTVQAPNVPPTAAFTSASNGLNATFDGSTSTDSDGTIASYAWAYGDGGTGTGVTSAHTYAAGGTYAVTLTVTDNRGGTGTVTQNVTVVKPNSPPTASFTSTSTSLTASFDGSGSTDSDGTIAAYAWNYGDGSAVGTGATSQHTYAASGTYQVTLTVTDNQGATNAVTNPVTVTRVNQAPTASFTATSAGLAASFDGTASSDSDGTVASWAWNYGDGTTGTGVTSTHAYAATGTYSVVLTVTDNEGATGALTKPVVITPPNVPPTSRFTSSVQYLTGNFDGTTSSDPDGTITAYAWDYGDGTTGTGATSSHTYATAATYTVTLTVTDNSGATNSSTGQVTTTNPPYAADAFGRSVTNGWGTADIGGAWTLAGGATSFGVGNGTGNITVAAGQSKSAFLNAVSRTDAVTTLGVTLDQAQTGAGTYLTVVGRHTSGGDYNVRARTLSNGAVTLQFTRLVAGTETTIGSAVTIPGLTYTAGDQLMVTFSVTGTGTTNLAAKAWKTGQTEPSSWAVTGSDTTAGLQIAGGVGLTVYVSGSFTGGPEGVHVDNLVTR